MDQDTDTRGGTDTEAAFVNGYEAAIKALNDMHGAHRTVTFLQHLAAMFADPMHVRQRARWAYARQVGR